MPQNHSAADTILIVDDEEPVRQTFREWLDEGSFDCRILAAADAEAALVLANEHTIDLAILDWNLGAGNDGLKLLEDLYLFNPDVVAIMITGFAHQATPLDAMRMGVRDYLDKNQDLDRDTFLKAVRRQLEHIRPAKRERRLHGSLVAFREAVEKIIPLVQSATALNDPVPLPAAIASLFGFLLRSTGARDGVLLVRSYDADRQPAEICRVYDAAGEPLAVELIPFSRSVAGTVVSLEEPYAMNRLEPGNLGAIELQPFERGRRSLLAAPLNVAPGIHVVLELFDKSGPATAAKGETPFTEEDRRLVAAAADFGAEMLRQALTERQAQRVLLDAVAAALGASDSVAAGLSLRLQDNHVRRMEEPPAPAILDRLREGLAATSAGRADAEETLRLAEAIRVLALRHGPAAVQHCIHLVEDLRKLLDTVTGTVEARS